MKATRTIVVLTALIFLTTCAIQAAIQPKKTPAASTPQSNIRKADSAKTEQTPPTKITWLTYDKGIDLAKKTNKYMFVDYTATWCGWCKKMEAEVFNQPEVIGMLTKHFVPIKLWGDSDDTLNIDGYRISQKNYVATKGIQGYPTFVFESPSREPLIGFSGYRDAETLVNYLTQVKAFIDTSQTLRAKSGAKPAGK